MVRLIPKSTRIKMQFYKGITLFDIMLGFIALVIIAVVVSSNLPYKFIIALAIVCVFLPLFLSIGEEKIYMSVFYMLKHLFSKNAYSKDEIDSIVNYSKIANGFMLNKDGTYVGVMEIKPIEFDLLSSKKQDYIIDGVVATALESVGANQELGIIKLEKQFRLEKHIENELKRLETIAINRENNYLSDKEYESRVDITQDRLALLDNLNSEMNVKYSAYYLTLIDRDEKNLSNSLNYIKQLFTSSGLEANILDDKELLEFIELANIGENIASDSEITLKAATPKHIEFKALNTLQDDKVLSHFVVSNYPLKVANAWGEALFDIPNTKVVMKLKAVDKSKAIRRIDNAIMELSAQAGGKASKIIDKSTHVETLSNLLMRLQNDNETLFDVTLIITAYDTKGSNANKKMVRQRLKEQGLGFNEMFGRQQEAYLASGICVYDKLNISRSIPSTSIAACFPFVSNALVDDNGIILGENKLPVIIDFFKRNSERINSNMVIIGKSGSGKSYATMTMLTHLASLNSKVFILDPDNEYSKLAGSLNGKVLDVASAKFGRLNPFQIITSLDDKNDDGTHNSFFAHLQFLEGFFRLIFEGLNADCFEVLNKLVLEVYSFKGIGSDCSHLELCPSIYPTFDDLAWLIGEKIKSEQDSYTLSCLKLIENYLAKFTSGGRNSSLWNGVSSFDVSENFVCFNFQKLLANKNNSIANAQMLLVLKWIENEVIKNRDYNAINKTDRKIVIVIDEAHSFIDEKYPIALDFMYSLGKRIRKYDGMQIVITQNIKDFMGTPEIAKKSMAIINVSQYSIIFSLSPNDISDLCNLYEKSGQINETEADNITHNPQGTAFLISSPSNRTNIKFVATPFIESLFKE